jgi:hypothetical protein
MQIRDLDHPQTHIGLGANGIPESHVEKLWEVPRDSRVANPDLQRVSHSGGKVRTDPVDKSRSTFSGFSSDAIFFFDQQTQMSCPLFWNVETSCLACNADNSN